LRIAAPYLAVNVLTSTLGVRFALSGPGSARPGHVHAGVDLSGQPGEAVLAMAAGVVRGVWVSRANGRTEVSPGPGGVVLAKSFGALPRGAGLHVEIVHPPLSGGSPLHTVYMHLLSAEVRKGDRVYAGQTIGALGSSGVVSELPHLHWEVYEGPEDARGAQRPCLNPLGFQRYTLARKLGDIRTDRPGPHVWQVTSWFATLCFLRSRSARGKVGVDRPFRTAGGYFVDEFGNTLAGFGPDAPFGSAGAAPDAATEDVPWLGGLS